jgi:plastocyanin
MAPASAAPVRGTVTLPAALKSGRRHQGYWHIENGNVPVQPTAARGDTVVVLEGLKGSAPAPKTVTVEINGLQMVPSLVTLGPGSVVEIKNGDKVPHDLGIPESPNVMPVERLAAGQMRRVRFAQPGGYLVRCAEFPHLTLSVIVLGAPHFAVLDEKGGFKIADAPDGKGTLKVWARGRWVHDEPIEVAGRPVDVQVRVTGTGGETREQTTE